MPLHFTPADIPHGMTAAEKNASAAGQARTRRQSDKRFLERPFIAWDGEGVTRDDGRHDYVLLASSMGDIRSSVDGLRTVDCVETVLKRAATSPGCIHVIYGGGYDFNKWFTDLSQQDVRRIYDNSFGKWRNYTFGWRRGKSLFISDARGRSVTIYDVVSFFQTAFVSACDSYLGENFSDRELIVENKALRSSFSVADLPEIVQYNDAELRNLVALMDELRSRLYKVGLKPSRWDGPGAIASALMRRENVQRHRDVSVPSGPAEAARVAYAGGRFEVIRFGHVDAPAYEYDINSAYPAAMRELPDLSVGRWVHHGDDPGPLPYALYRCRLDGESVDWSVPFPLFRRSRMGNIAYPQRVVGWYWSPEVAVARQWAELTGATLTVEGVWEWQPGTDTRPFAFIEALYLKRQALKRGGDGAHVGIKLGLNSLYGKLAQQVGWKPSIDGGPVRIPPFHQLEWAGYVTSHARAQVLAASLEHLTSIIAYETDAVFSSSPLNVECGTGLGEWEYTVFDSLTYLQSGLYFGTLTDGTEVAKTRGIDRGSFTRNDALAGLARADACDRVGHARLSRFVGAGLALAQDFSRWGTWETTPKAIKLTPQGKRTHEFGCVNCDPSSVGETLGVWHETICPRYTGDVEESQPFPVEWINPNPMMRAAILREMAAEDKASDYE